jgi:hypothetical protein
MIAECYGIKFLVIHALRKKMVLMKSMDVCMHMVMASA